jgi:hypothetical protein
LNNHFAPALESQPSVLFQWALARKSSRVRQQLREESSLCQSRQFQAQEAIQAE